MRALLVLPVEKPRLGHIDEHRRAEGDFLVVMGGKRPVEELVQGLAVPHAIHVGFPKSERNIAGDALIDGIIVTLQIPGSTAIDADIRSAKQIFKPFRQFGHGWTTLSSRRNRIIPMRQVDICFLMPYLHETTAPFP